METHSFTTIEQSKELIKLGIPFDSHDMYYFSVGLIDPKPKIGKISDVVESKRHWTIPAWSLTGLLNLLPDVKLIRRKNFEPGKNETYIYHLSLISYYFSGDEYDLLVSKCYENPIDATIGMIKLLLEKDILKWKN